MGQNKAKAKKGEKTWTVWRTATELLDMHNQISLVSSTHMSQQVLPRKPRFKGSVDNEENLAGDRKAIGIYLNTFLRASQRESLPPVLMSFLEIREDEALSLSAEPEYVFGLICNDQKCGGRDVCRDDRARDKLHHEGNSKKRRKQKKDSGTCQNPGKQHESGFIAHSVDIDHSKAGKDSKKQHGGCICGT